MSGVISKGSVTKKMSEEQRKPQIRRMVIWPDPRLSAKCEYVTRFDDSLDHLVQDMFATMVANSGVGLAANQVGILKRVITIRVEQNSPFYLINPEIIESSDEMFKWEEGCLSVPGYFEDRERPARIAVRFKTVDGEEKEIEMFDLTAFAVQHEMDHLDGKTFVDDSSFFKKGRVKKKIKKALPDQVALSKYAEIHLEEWWDTTHGQLKTSYYEEQITGEGKTEDNLIKKDELI